MSGVPAQVLMDPTNGEAANVSIDLAELTLETSGPGEETRVVRFESRSALEIEYRGYAAHYYQLGWIDGETGTCKFLDLDRLAERAQLADAICVPDDRLALSETEMVLDVTDAICAAVRHIQDVKPISFVHVGRFEFVFALVTLDGHDVPASAFAEENAEYFRWEGVLHELGAAVGAEHNIQLPDVEMVGARIAARIERSQFLPADVAGRLSPTWTLHVCRMDGEGNSQCEREVAKAGLDTPLSEWLANLDKA